MFILFPRPREDSSRFCNLFHDVVENILLQFAINLTFECHGRKYLIDSQTAIKILNVLHIKCVSLLQVVAHNENLRECSWYLKELGSFSL